MNILRLRKENLTIKTLRSLNKTHTHSGLLSFDCFKCLHLNEEEKREQNDKLKIYAVIYFTIRWLYILGELESEKGIENDKVENLCSQLSDACAFRKHLRLHQCHLFSVSQVVDIFVCLEKRMHRSR